MRLCVVCPWQQILQLAHELGTSMHARGGAVTPRLAEAPAREGLLELQCSARRAALRELCNNKTFQHSNGRSKR
jgi:hypothetical protein